MGGAIGDTAAGSQYARKDAGWEEVEATSPTIAALTLDADKSITPAVNGEIHNVTLEGNHAHTQRPGGHHESRARCCRTIKTRRATGHSTAKRTETIANPGAVTPASPDNGLSARWISQVAALDRARYELVGAIFDVEAL